MPINSVMKSLTYVKTDYIKFSRDDGVERDTMLFLKHRELFSVMIGLLKVLMVEFNVSIEIMEKYQEEFLQTGGKKV